MKKIPLLAGLVLLLASCGNKAEKIPFGHDECNSVYYWRTDFRLDSIERDFIARHDIGRLYIRFFDVVAGDSRYDLGEKGSRTILPNATIKFSDSIPQSVGHIVPTVYITVEALKSMRGQEANAASKIVRRVLNMVSYNEIAGVDELQLDCDWTASTDSIYFNLCRAVRDTISVLAPVPYTLSSTIRLHQLKKAAPPVDYGVLMCYNTGSFLSPDCNNSILDYRDVEPYLRSDISYPLHLDVAFPIYDWTLSYRDGRFNGIVRSDMSHETDSDMLRRETSDIGTISRVAELLDRRLERQPRSIILYHLDSKNIQNYSKDEITQIYRRDSI